MRSAIAACRHLPVSQWSPAALREVAAAYQWDNYGSSDAGYCKPHRANWSYVEELSLDLLRHLMDSTDAWRQWFQDELRMDELEELHRDWHVLTQETVKEEVVILVRDGKGYIWDGWHRVGASIVAGRSHIKAIVGYPL